MEIQEQESKLMSRESEIPIDHARTRRMTTPAGVWRTDIPTPSRNQGREAGQVRHQSLHPGPRLATPTAAPACRWRERPRHFPIRRWTKDRDYAERIGRASEYRS